MVAESIKPVKALKLVGLDDLAESGLRESQKA